MPTWADGKEDAFEMLAKRWVGEDVEFAAVSEQNRRNRGKEGTHSAGNRSHGRYKEKLVCTYIYMERPAFISPHVPT
jgi:hypothetical protein